MNVTYRVILDCQTFNTKQVTEDIILVEDWYLLKYKLEISYMKLFGSRKKLLKLRSNNPSSNEILLWIYLNWFNRVNGKKMWKKYKQK